jgi:dihydroorotase
MSGTLILKGGRVLDPSQGIDDFADVAFAGGRVTAIGTDLDTSGAEVRDVAGLIVSPGFIDSHTHVYWGGTSLGVDAGELARRSGVTTFVDAGSAGPGNYRGFLKHVIEPSEPRILAYLHVSFAGIFAASRNIVFGESEDMRLISPVDVLAVARDNPETIVGIKVRIGRFGSGDSGTAPLDIASQVAEEVGLPLMAHIDEPPPTYEEVLKRLRPGDVLTHCFRPSPNTPLLPNGDVRPEVFRAREAGVLFDIGHGKGSFSFETARTMLAAGFPPDTISSDIHDLNIEGPVRDQVTTLSKFLNLGMPLAEVIKATTVNAAEVIRRPDLGSLRPGAAGDATIYSLETGQFPFVDSVGEMMIGDQRIVVAGSVIAGRSTRQGSPAATASAG